MGGFNLLIAPCCICVPHSCGGSGQRSYLLTSLQPREDISQKSISKSYLCERWLLLLLLLLFLLLIYSCSWLCSDSGSSFVFQFKLIAGNRRSIRSSWPRVGARRLVNFSGPRFARAYSLALYLQAAATTTGFNSSYFESTSRLARCAF